MKRWMSLLAALFLALPAAALEPDERLDDPALEARARALSAELRCVVCQNQSIDDSPSPLARDMRMVVRERLTAGDTDEEVQAYLVDRYGDYVLLRPPMRPSTYALWFGPPVIFVVAAGALVWGVRRRRGPLAEPEPLTPEERRALEAALAEEETPR